MKTLRNLLFLTIISCLTLTSCEKPSIQEDAPQQKIVNVTPPTDTTNSYKRPVVSTLELTNITYTTASCGGNVTQDNGESVTEKGLVISTNPTPTINDTKITNTLGGAGSYNLDITNLTPGTTYYVRAYAINKYGVGYGLALNFKTTTTTAPVISYTASSMNGISYLKLNILSDGGSPITETGLCYVIMKKADAMNMDINTLSISTSNEKLSLTNGYVLVSDLKSKINSDECMILKFYAINDIGITYTNLQVVVK